MNIYSVLDESDEEKFIEPKKAAVVKSAAGGKSGGKDNATSATAKSKSTTEKKAGKGENVAPSNTSAPGRGKDSGRTTKPAPPAVGEFSAEEAPGSGKDNNRGGKPRGKEPRRRTERKGESEEAGNRRPKHEFDRRSGTGRGKELAKGGRGSYGAGNVNQDAQDAEKHPHEAEEILEPKWDEGGFDSSAPAVETAEEVKEVEPEPVTYTLDEYMRKRDEARREALQLLGSGEKKPSRAVDASVEFAGLKSMNPEVTDNYMPTRNAKNSDLSRKDQRSTSKAKVLDVGFTFEHQSHGDRGGRGRGSGRGRGDRGSGRGDRGGGRGGRGDRGRSTGGPSAGTVFNSEDFPSL